MSALSSDPPPVRVRTDEHALAVYELARVEELRGLDLQWKEAEGIRTRTAQYLAFIGATTGFLLAAAPKSDKGLALWALAGLGTILALLAIFFAGCISLGRSPRHPLKGRIVWAFKLNPGETFSFAEQQLPGPPTEAQMANYLASKYAEMSHENQRPLLLLRKIYAAFLICGASQLLAWTTLVWVKA